MTTTTTPASTDAIATGAAAELAATLAAAWNGADGDAFGSAFTDDADFVDIRGDHHHGRGAIAAGHQAILESIYAGSTIDYRVEAVRAVGDDTAVAAIAATLDAPTGPLAGTTHSRITAVLVAREGTWAIAAFHNTLRAENPGGR